MLPMSAAYSRAAARAVRVPTAGTSARSTSGRLPMAASGRTAGGATASKCGRCAEANAIRSARPLSSRVASRGRSASGRPLEEQFPGYAQRGGHVLGQHGGDPSAGDPADHLADQPAVRPRVVGDLFAGRPAGHCVGDQRAHRVPVGEVGRGDVGGQVRHPGGVGEHVPQCDGVLAVPAELGPDVGDAQVVVEPARFGEDVHHRRRAQALAGGDTEDRVLVVNGRPVAVSAVPAVSSTIRLRCR